MHMCNDTYVVEDNSMWSGQLCIMILTNSNMTNWEKSFLDVPKLGSPVYVHWSTTPHNPSFSWIVLISVIITYYLYLLQPLNCLLFMCFVLNPWRNLGICI